MQKFRSDSGMVLGKNSQELIYQQISDIAAQLTPIETKETDLKARLDLLTTRSDRSLTEVVESSLVQGLKSRLSQASQKLESLRADFGENHPEVIALRKEISQINDDIQKEVTNIRAAIENERTAISKQK